MSRSRKFKLTQHRSYQRRLRTRDADNVPVEHTYDLVGKIQQANDPTGTYAFAYDNMGRLIGTTTTYSFLTTPFTNSYSYDADSNRTGFTAPDSSANTYTYDTLNRLTTLANSWAGSFGFSYDAISRRTQMTRPNGIATNYAYDKLSHLLSVLHQAGTSTIDGEAYTLDAAGNRTAKQDYLAGVTSNYSYDKIYELTQAMQGTNTTESYSYDPAGNRTASLGIPSYTTNSSNELTATSNASYTYDYNGNTTSKTDSTGTTNYTWDFENRLTQATLPGTGGTVQFRYDPFGKRIQKAFAQNGTTTTTNYVYDGDDSIEETDQNGSLLAKYARTTNIDQPLAESRLGTTSYYEQDGLGSVTSVTSGTGAVAQTYAFDSFGKLTASSGSVTNPFRYTGREFDAETNLYYYRARYYDPSSGRFLSEDPIQFGGGINFYAYVGNNATNRTDPDGTAFKDCAKALADLATAQADVELRVAELLPSADAGHIRRLKQAYDTLEWAIGQVKKYCKCNPKIVAILAAAAAAVAKAAEALAQFCSEVPVCEFAKNDGHALPEDRRLAVSYIANAGREPVHGKAFGRAATRMNWAVDRSHCSCNIDEASLMIEGGKALLGEEAPYLAAAG